MSAEEYDVVPLGDEPDESADESSVDEPETESQFSAAARNALEWVVVLVCAVAIALVVRAFLFQSFWIKSGSMEDTLMIRDRVVVNRLSYQWGEPDTGDIVVFSRPETTALAEDDLIKRVIAVPGDTLEAIDGQLLLNGEVLEEPYLKDGAVTRDFGPVTVGDGELWVMGDNRSNSSDSRFFGPVSADDVIGRAFIRYWPLGRFGSP